MATLPPFVLRSRITLPALAVAGLTALSATSLSGTATASAAASGALSLAQGISGAASATGAASGGGTLDQSISASTTATVTASGDVTDGNSISGTATATVNATGALTLNQVIAGGATATANATGDVTSDTSPPTIAGSLPDAVITVGEAMTPIDTLSIATGATGATLIGPAALPAGLSFSGVGVLSGTPAAKGACFILVRATNAGGSSVHYGFTLEIEPATSATIVENPGLAYNAGEHSYYNPQDPFLNKAKGGSAIFGVGGTSHGDLVTAGLINANGYPTGVGATGETTFRSYFAWGDFQAASAFAGDYIIKWDVLSGDGGSFSLGGGTSAVTSAGTRRITFTASGSNWWFDFAIATGYPTNIRICRAEHEDLLDEGGVWNPAFLAIHHNTRELRFLDWLHTNNSTWSDYAADKTQVGAYTYTPASGAQVSVPVEIMCDLCNVLTCDAWFPLPHLFTDASVTAFAQDVLANLDPSLRAKFEWSNEVWNSGFTQFDYALAQSNADWGAGTNDAVGWQTKRAVQCAQLIDAVYTGQTSRRVNVLGGFNAIPFNTTQMLSAATWFAEEPADDIPANDPLTVFQEFAITTYFGASGDIINAGLVSAYGVSQDNGDEYLYASLLNAANETSIPDTLDLIDQHLTAISNLGGGPRLSLYEGGQHVHFSSAVSPAIDAELLAFCQGDHMADLYQRIWDGLEARNVGPFMQFTDVGTSSQFGTWGLRQSLIDTTPRRIAYVEAKARQTDQWWTDSRPAGTYTGGAAVVRDARIHGDMHSIWSHNTSYANLSVWLHRMQLVEPDLDFYVGGRFLVGQDYSAPPLIGDHVYNGAQANAYVSGATLTWAAFDAAGITDYAYSPFNFDDSTGASDFHSANFSARISAVSANTDPTPRFFMYRPWDDFAWYLNAGNGGSGTAFPGAEQDFLDWRDNFATRRPAMTTMLDTVLSTVKAAHPTEDIYEVNVNEMLKRVLANTALEPLRAADLFEDAAPHGLDVLYLVAAMITHSTIYNRPAPIDMDLTGATLPSQFTSNIRAIRDYIWAEVANAAQTPPGGIAFASTISGNASAAVNATGALTLNQTIAAGASASGTATGAVTLDQVISAASTASADATGNVELATSLSGTATATVDATGALVLDQSASAATTAAVDATGAVTLDQAVSAASTASVDATGDVTLPAGEPALVEFPGGTGIYNISGYTGSFQQFTCAMRITPRTGWDNFEQMVTGVFECYVTAGGGPAERLGLNIGGNFPQANLVDGGGSPIDQEFSVLFVCDGAGIAGAGGQTLRLYIDGRLAATDTGTFAAQTVAAHHGFLGGQFAVGPTVGIRRMWAAYAAIDDYAAFFNADDTCVALSGTGDVSGVTPDFWQEGAASVWNSGTDQNGNTYTVGSTFT